MHSPSQEIKTRKRFFLFAEQNRGPIFIYGRSPQQAAQTSIQKTASTNSEDRLQDRAACHSGASLVFVMEDVQTSSPGAAIPLSSLRLPTIMI